MKIKYHELSAYEISVLLYLSKLLSLYDGMSSSLWKYDFANCDSGVPISRDVFYELEELSKNGQVKMKDDFYYNLSDTVIINKINILASQKYFGWRTKYIECSVNATLSKSISKVLNAIQNEPGIKYYKELERSSILYDGSDTSNMDIDRLFDDFAVLKEVVGDGRHQIIVPASVWIEYLSECQ